MDLRFVFHGRFTVFGQGTAVQFDAFVVEYHYAVTPLSAYLLRLESQLFHLQAHFDHG